MCNGSVFSQVGLRGGLSIWVNIEDGWGPCAGGCPLRHAAAQRATSPAFQAEEERGRSVLMRSIETVGAVAALGQAQGICIALALEAFGADLGEALDVVAHRDQGSDAGEESSD
jgi:hypothetical protein